MTLGAPPKVFDPLRESIPAGTILYRVHEPVLPRGTVNDGTLPNPGLGKPTRFGFFGDPIVPVLYVADKPEGAVHESVLHDVEEAGFVPGVQWRSKVLTVLEVDRDIDVASFHSDGLRRFGLYASDLTDTDRTVYPRTVKWSEAAWGVGTQGVSYMSRHFNSSKAICLFGDRLGTDALHPVPGHSDARAFAVPRDAEWLASIALAMHVVLRP